MNTIEAGFRIKQAIGLTGYNVKEFCEKTNRSRVTTALWISGRGGLIKDQSLEDLCNDLKKCNVSCHLNWIKFGTDTPPTIFKKNTTDESTSPLELKLLNINIDSMLGHLKKYDSDNYFDENDEKYYAIASIINKDTIERFKNNIVVILTTNKECHIGMLIGNCKTSNTVVINELTNKIYCINKDEISKLGRLVFYINKNI